MATNDKAPAGAVPTRWVELVVALALVVLRRASWSYDSHRVGVEWADDGPRSGYFPNFIGWILAASPARGSPARRCWRWKALAGKVFVTREELKPVLCDAAADDRLRRR